MPEADMDAFQARWPKSLLYDDALRPRAIAGYPGLGFNREKQPQSAAKKHQGRA
jgi:hypothetical protein